MSSGEKKTLPEGWKWARLGEIVDLSSSKSISTTGDREVQAITTACLNENEFDPAGIKTARMKAGDVYECLVEANEILVARSNTPELVGRATIYRGKPDGIVASDLTIRIRVKNGTNSDYLARYLAALFLSGY